MIRYSLVWIMGQMLKGIEALCEGWRFMRGYDSMKNRGYILMTSEDGEEFWVGYGD